MRLLSVHRRSGRCGWGARRGVGVSVLNGPPGAGAVVVPGVTVVVMAAFAVRAGVWVCLRAQARTTAGDGGQLQTGAVGLAGSEKIKGVPEGEHGNGTGHRLEAGEGPAIAHYDAMGQHTEKYEGLIRAERSSPRDTGTTDPLQGRALPEQGGRREEGGGLRYQEWPEKRSVS